LSFVRRDRIPDDVALSEWREKTAAINPNSQSKANYRKATETLLAAVRKSSELAYIPCSSL
jgi:hypothetical protein